MVHLGALSATDEGDYLNCPMTKAEYDAFYAALVAAESATVHDFDNTKFFEGCLPIEVMAHRGEGTLRFGPMKPVGLKDPRTGHLPYAVVQLRQDTLAGDHYSLVGFQTQIKWGDQARVLKMIPGLENAEFVRYGMVHRNTYICGPKVLLPTWQTRHRADLLFAGQVSGVEGYVESAASGLIAGRNAAAIAKGEAPQAPPRTTAIGSLAYYVSHADPKTYQPTNITHGIMPPLDQPPRDKMKKKLMIAERALADLDAWRGAVRRGGTSSPANRVPWPDMRDHLKSFLAFLKHNRHVSPHTLRAYESDVTQYLAWVASETGKKMSALEAADLDMLSARSHLTALNKAGKARSSVARKLSALKTFVRYLRREDLIEHDPTAMAVAPKRDQTIPVFLSEQEITRLIETPNTGDPLGRRDRAILELFYASGLRLSELVAVDMEDLNLSGRMVRVMGKGRKERLLPFNQSAADAIRAWMKDRALILAARRSGQARSRRSARRARGRTTRCSSTIAGPA